MDEVAGSWSGADGEVIDSGGAALHGYLKQTAGTFSNAVVPSPAIDEQHSIQGRFCNAGRFDGNAYVAVPHDKSFEYTQRMSASVWFYVPAAEYPTTGAYAILSNDKNYELLLLEGSRVVQWWWDNGKGGGESLRTSSQIPADRWTHIAITFDGEAGTQAIYVNGNREGSLSWKGTLQPNPCPFLIGADVESDGRCTLSKRNFRGMIDEVKLYDHVLSEDGVRADMTLGRQCSGVFDHIRIEHGGSGAACSIETVTVKACLDATCSALYKGAVTVGLSPSGWDGGGILSFSDGQASARLNYGGNGNVTLGTANVTPAPSGGTRCFIGSVESCAMNFGSGSACEFDAVEPGAPWPSNLFTKPAGTGFSLDLLAIKTTPQREVDSNFTGHVSVELIDASQGCATGTYLYKNAVDFEANSHGRVTFPFESGVASAVRSVRVRIQQYPGGIPTGLPSCSTDVFAVRPRNLSVTSSANADLAGTNPAASPVVKAGEPFTLTADSGRAGYDGLPRIDPALIEWASAPAGVVGVLDGETPGRLSFTTAASAASGNGAGGHFAYDEAGYFRFKPNGVHDDSFVELSGDKANGDCIAGSFSNTVDASGRYGCNFGNTAATAHFGRFIPDRFDTAVTQGCAAGGFTYSGQPFDLTVTAKNAGGGITRNYAGSFARDVMLAARDAADTSDDPGPGHLDPSTLMADGFLGGVGSISPIYAFAQKDTAPADARIRAGDGEASSVASSEGRAAIRSGRAFLGSAYGPEQSDLPVPFRVEYFDGAIWQRNVDDRCTGDTTVDGNNAVSIALTLSPPGLDTCVLDAGKPGLSGAGCAASAMAEKCFLEGATPSQGFAGDFNLWLQAPGAGQFGTARIDAALPPWLGPATATATFGRKKSPLIYRRESY